MTQIVTHCTNIRLQKSASKTEALVFIAHLLYELGLVVVWYQILRLRQDTKTLYCFPQSVQELQISVKSFICTGVLFQELVSTVD